MKEKIIEILRDQISIKSTKSLYQLAAELESLFQQEYLNSCIEKATPALSKIKDVDKELAWIQETDKLAEKIAKTDYMDTEKTCWNCRFTSRLVRTYPCNECDYGHFGLKWEPIK